MARLLPPVRASLFPRVGVELSYTGFIRNIYTGHPITGGLTNLTAEASLDGGALSSTGITVAEDGVTGEATVTVAALQMAADYGTIYVSCDNADSETLTIDFRTDGIRQLSYGIPVDMDDVRNGDYCQAVGILCPRSCLKDVDGYTVGEYWDTGMAEDRKYSPGGGPVYRD